MSGHRNSSTRGRPPNKKALLIGIGYHTGEDAVDKDKPWSPIPTSIPNVTKFAAFLREHCGYKNIVIMTDEEETKKTLQPTKQNLKREMWALCRRVRPGDRRVIYFAGHSDQMPSVTGSEEDGMDEVLVTANGLKIRDNTLHNWLVKRLPPGSALTAIFDSCNSGTLLDLPHYRCNNVYRPWVNKGKRRSNTLRNRVVRKNGKCTRSVPQSRRSTCRKGTGEVDANHPSLIQILQSLETQSPTPLADDTSTKHYGVRCTSPERQFCEGWCRDKVPRRATLEHQADVISISSSNDGQISWDASTRNGDSISMTTFLISIIKQHPHISFSELMTRLNHEVHSFTRSMHDTVGRQSSARRKAGGGITGPEDPEGSEGEMNNFQDLQLGSLTPVDMDRPFIL